jgi:hypothetical protein
MSEKTKPELTQWDHAGAHYMHTEYEMRQAIEPLQNRIAELEKELIEQARIIGIGAEREIASLAKSKSFSKCIALIAAKRVELEAKIAHLTASLETASAACIVLKQQQREGWAQLASGQGPVAEIAHTDSTGGYVNWLLHQGAPIKMGDKLFTQPAQKPLNRDQILDLYEETDPLCSLFTFRDIVADVEAEHNIKDKP